MQTDKAVKAAAEKRTREGVLFMECTVCGKKMRKWRSQVKRAKLPMTCGVKCRSRGMRGKGNPNWMGGAWTDNTHGYRIVATRHLSKDDQKLLPSPAPREYLEHRLIMARSLKRILKPEEHVHHRNGVKGDNRIENLALMDWSHHSREHRLLEREVSRLRAENKSLRNALAAH